jgi:hypothetical protein
MRVASAAQRGWKQNDVAERTASSAVGLSEADAGL